MATKLTTVVGGRRKKATTLGAVSKHITSFVDHTKKTIQHAQSTPVFDQERKYKCFWCDLPVENTPLGCPIKQIPVFSGKKVKLRNNEEFTTSVSQQENQNKFVTEKVFCSFNCVKGFINANSWNDYYFNSSRLLALMYSTIMEVDGPVIITPAPCKSIMAAYGGILSPEQYRKNFERVNYRDSGSISMFPISHLFEEEDQI